MKTEEIDCGGFFDNIDDFLDVPNDDVVAASSLPPIDLDSFPGIWSDVMTGDMQESSFPCSDSVFSNSDISAELSVPYEDIVQLEWLSSFVEDSFSAGDGSGSSSSVTINMSVKDSPEKQWLDHCFRTPSPVSVLDSSSSCSTEKTSNAIAPSRCGRARTKRPRPTTANFRPVTTPPLPLALVSPASENSVESRIMIEIPNHSKKKKIKFTLPAAPAPGDGDDDLTSHPIRKCQHCEITKTPQWRAGPMGPKTLCNACGVRYKSGRLFPEYRPAASPTFVPTVHSNSHKKVLEMRNKTDGRAVNGGGSTMIELIPNSRVAADYV